MKKLSRWKWVIVKRLKYWTMLGMGFVCGSILFENWEEAQWMAWISGALCAMHFLVKKFVPDPPREPGYYWVKIETGSGPVWIPAELHADGRWEYIGSPWAVEEEWLLDIGKRIEHK